MSWKSEVQTTGDSRWNTNDLRFATRDEAALYADDLMFRWTQVTDCRATECDDPVTHSYLNRDLKRITE